jgi:UDP-glucuronate 4-epimerase
MKLLVTGAAGFIGMHATQRLLERGDTVVGIDNLNDYYDVRLKQARLRKLEPHRGFHFEQIDLCERERLHELFAREKFDRVVHLAAQAGVRYSLQNPHAYVRSNLEGFVNVLEGCRHHKVQHLVYASSSSVYGGNKKQPFSETDWVDHPVSLYASTKKSNELMAHAYAHLYGMPVTGLRFFTVYGPWGRPDMAYFLFTTAILQGRPIDLFNHGDMKRDFTYVDDVVEGLVRVVDRVATPVAGSDVPARLFNIGNHEPVALGDFVACIEKSLGKTAVKRYLPMQDGDVPATYADVTALREWVGFHPDTRLEDGIGRFVRWYGEHYATIAARP